MQEIKIVLGSLFGDEGKGNVVQYLCKKALNEGKKPIVIRFCGGPQAGHRIVHNGKSHIASTFGSGVLLDVPTFYAGTTNCFIDPICLKNEKELLESLGLQPKIMIAGFPCIITPYDVIAGRTSERVVRDGTCGKGIFPTFYRYTHSPINPYTFDYLEDAAKFFEIPRDESIENVYNESIKILESIKDNTPQAPILNTYDVLIFEGTQGLLLDKDFGFMPHCTPSNVGLKGIYSGFLNLNPEVYLVTRTYLTRHGNGYEPIEDKLEEFLDTSYEPTNLDTGFQGKFKKGLFDVRLFLRALDRHTLDNYNVQYKLVVTHCDCVKDEYVPFIDSFGYESVSTLDYMISDITTHSDVKFSDVILFDKEEM
jgi:adenylosuccinate synthase